MVGLLHAVLRNPDTRSVVFNPAGLSLVARLNPGATDRTRINADNVVFTTRNDIQIEPISGLPFAGRSVIRGRLIVIAMYVVDERALYGPTGVAAAAEGLATTKPAATPETAISMSSPDD